MKTINFITTALFLLIINTIQSQSNFDKGFDKGYKEGFCYEKPACVAPISPISPIPKSGESADSYTDGYNRGFQRGQKTQKSNNGSIDNSNRTSTVTTSKYEAIYDYSYYMAMTKNKAQKIYNLALEYKSIIDKNLKTVKDKKLRMDIYDAKYYLDKVFVNGVRIGDAEDYLRKTKKLYNKAIRKYNKRIKKD